MKTWLQKQRASTLLGLAFDGRRFEGVALRRTNGSAQVTRTFAFELTQDPAIAPPEAVGRELREQLDKAEIRDRRCAVCLPVGWALAVLSPATGIPEEDLPEFLQIEAERGFPYDAEDLMTTSTRLQTRGGGVHILQMAVSRAHIARLEEILRSARLTPVTFSFGLPMWNQSVASGPADAVTLAVEGNQISQMVTAGGSVAVLRTLATAVDSGESGPRVDTEALGRELRISLGELPADIREGLTKLRILGDGPVVDQVAAGLERRASSLGLTVERPIRLVPGQLGVGLPAEVPPTPQLALAARHIAGKPAEHEFLPPKVSAWQNLAGKYSSRKLTYTAAVIGGVALIVAMMFAYQQVQLMSLRSQWASISPKVRELDDMQLQIRRFRPWFDDSHRHLNILRRLTEAFPTDGAVTAKSVELRDGGLVICSGTARDNPALMTVLDRLRGSSDVADVQVDQLRGRSPVQFTFNFHWGTAPRQQ